MLKKVLLLLLISTLFFACKKEPKKYNLKWNMPSKDLVIYNIQTTTIDSLSNVSEKAMQALVETVSNIYGESVKLDINSANLYEGLIKQLNMLSYFAIVRLDDDKNLKVDFITRQTKQYEPIKYVETFNKFIRKAFFKGVLRKDGVLLTSEGEDAWDPKINILFQLPEKPVAVGESWPLNIVPGWQQTDNDSTIINKVTLTNISVDSGDSIATLQYELQNREPSGKTMGFHGNAKFNISKGKWIAYNGILSQKNVGMLAMKQVQSIKLSEISVAKYKSILKQAQKVSIFDVGEKPNTGNNQEESIENKQSEVKPTEQVKADCPEVFRVQIMASKTGISDFRTKFADISYKVDELVLNNSEYKYKYTVGKKCSREEVEILLKEIRKVYPKAYIIKTINN